MIRIHKSAIVNRRDDQDSLWKRMTAHPRKPATISLYADNHRFIRQDDGQTIATDCVGDLPAIEVDRQALLSQLCKIKGDWVLLASDSQVLQIEGQGVVRRLPCKPLHH